MGTKLSILQNAWGHVPGHVYMHCVTHFPNIYPGNHVIFAVWSYSAVSVVIWYVSLTTHTSNWYHSSKITQKRWLQLARSSYLCLFIELSYLNVQLQFITWIRNYFWHLVFCSSRMVRIIILFLNFMFHFSNDISKSEQMCLKSGSGFSGR